MRQTGEWIHGKYQVERVLGRGGMGTVYATTRRNRSRAAVKVLHPRFAVDKTVRARFLEEGFLANRVEHPAVVTILEDDIDEEGNFYLVMELLDGVDLGQFVGPPRTPVSTAEALNIAEQLLSVLEVAHQRGIVHLDIKPANLMILRDGRLKLLDFGIAKALGDVTIDSDFDDDEEEEEVFGSDRYMAPEQGKGFLDEVDARSDLWAVGALLLALLADEAPETVPLWDQCYEDRAWAFSRLGQRVPPYVVQIISLALQPQKSKRWASATAMKEAVQAAHLDLYGPIEREALTKLVAGKLSAIPASVALRDEGASSLALSPEPPSLQNSSTVDPTQRSSRSPQLPCTSPQSKGVDENLAGEVVSVLRDGPPTEGRKKSGAVFLALAFGAIALALALMSLPLDRETGAEGEENTRERLTPPSRRVENDKARKSGVSTSERKPSKKRTQTKSSDGDDKSRQNLSVGKKGSLAANNVSLGSKSGLSRPRSLAPERSASSGPKSRVEAPSIEDSEKQATESKPSTKESTCDELGGIFDVEPCQ